MACNSAVGPVWRLHRVLDSRLIQGVLSEPEVGDLSVFLGVSLGVRPFSKQSGVFIDAAGHGPADRARPSRCGLGESVPWIPVSDVERRELRRWRRSDR
jgi:hypothetical protein